MAKKFYTHPENVAEDIDDLIAPLGQDAPELKGKALKEMMVNEVKHASADFDLKELHEILKLIEQEVSEAPTVATDEEILRVDEFFSDLPLSLSKTRFCTEWQALKNSGNKVTRKQLVSFLNKVKSKLDPLHFSPSSLATSSLERLRKLVSKNGGKKRLREQALQLDHFASEFVRELAVDSDSARKMETLLCLVKDGESTRKVIQQALMDLSELVLTLHPNCDLQLLRSTLELVEMSEDEGYLFNDVCEAQQEFSAAVCDVTDVEDCLVPTQEEIQA